MADARVVSMRRCVRVPFFTDVTLAAIPDGVPIRARSIDISLRGIGVACPRALPIGKAYALTFRLATPGGGTTSERVVGKIANVRFESDATIVGIEFAPPPDRLAAPNLVRTIEKL